jgi:signal transduction histidine kinase
MEPTYLQNEQSQAILGVLSALSYRSHSLSSYLHEITCGVNRLLNSDWTIVTLCEGETGQVIASNSPIENANRTFAMHQSVANTVVQSGQPLMIEDASQSVYSKQLNGYFCYLGVPLRTLHGEVLGTICSFSHRTRQYTLEVIATVELQAELAATAIDNYRLYQQQQQFNEMLEAEVSKRTVELQAAQSKLIEHERLAAIGEFTAMIVHEIRNPLTTVQMGLNYLTKLDLCESAQVRLSLAMSEAERLTNLLQEILIYSKPQALQLEKIDINHFIEELLVSLLAMPEAQGRGIEFTSFCSGVTMNGDRNKLKQVFINIVRNACEAVSPGEVIFWQLTRDSTTLCISVHNGGEPIPVDILPQLTQPFYSTKSEGTGLGLAIVKRIVEAHRGELIIESSVNVTTVSVHLPLQTES